MRRVLQADGGAAATLPKRLPARRPRTCAHSHRLPSVVGPAGPDVLSRPGRRCCTSPACSGRAAW